MCQLFGDLNCWLVLGHFGHGPAIDLIKNEAAMLLKKMDQLLDFIGVELLEII